MTFLQAINKFELLRSIFDEMVVKTTMGREKLLNTELSTDKTYLLRHWSLVQDCELFLHKLSQNEKMLLECILYDVHNIKGSLKLLRQGEVLDDIALFEVKAFCLSIKKLKEKTKTLNSEEFRFKDLGEVLAILDPENTQTQQFYIYPAYNESLKPLRQEFETLKLQGDDKAAEVYNQIILIENQVRQELAKELAPYCQLLEYEIDRIALLDECIAKAELNEKFSLTKPEFSTDIKISYTKIFNPIIAQILAQQGRQFQAIDITLNEESTLITGANMAGKTVILKTLALSQLMIQFGFFAPCERCETFLVEDVLCSIGDMQDESKGLSSFASEILNLDSILQRTKSKGRYLILVDELARTTNPFEGQKLLNGFLKTLANRGSFAVITTHYSGIDAPCKRLRVRGFINKNQDKITDINSLSDQVDYSLVEDNSDKVPTEALNLCKLLGIDPQWLEFSLLS